FFQLLTEIAAIEGIIQHPLMQSSRIKFRYVEMTLLMPQHMICWMAHPTACGRKCAADIVAQFSVFYFVFNGKIGSSRGRSGNRGIRTAFVISPGEFTVGRPGDAVFLRHKVCVCCTKQ